MRGARRAGGRLRGLVRRGVRPASLRGRVVVGVLGLLLVLLVLLFVVVDLVLAARLRADLRTRLTDRVALARQLDAQLGSWALVDHLRGEGVTAELCTDGAGCVTALPVPAPAGAPAGAADATRPTDPAGAAGASSASAPLPTPARPAAAAGAVQTSGSTLYVRTALADGQQLTLSVDDSAVTSALSRLVVLEAVGGAVALALAGLALGGVVGVALRPLDRMTALARGTAGGERGQRLGTGRTDTELGRTAVAFDAMLDELESALATASAAEAAMRAFLSDASHELRTPLAALQATVENVLRVDPDRAARERALAVVVRESVRASRLVDDLLAVTRLGGGVELEVASVDLAELARQEVERHRLLAPQLAWRVEADAAVPVEADPARLAQVISNLLDNARHATPAGGSVVVRAARGASAAGEQERVVLEVADTGPGVPEADLERIFDRLVRLDASRSRSSGGAGLGLSIARAIARRHGGDLVALATPPGSGARLRLQLPVPPRAAGRRCADGDPGPG